MLNNIKGLVKNEFDSDFIILLEGREESEKAFVMIHEHQFWGFGYVPKEEVINSREQWNDYIHYQYWYPEANGIIKRYLEKNQLEILPL